MPFRPLHALKGPIQEFKRNWFAIEAIPLYAAVGGIVTGGLYFLLVKAGTHPEVVWSRSNPTPWNTVAQDETFKVGNKLGPRKDAAGTPQLEYERKWNRFESAARAKEGKVSDYNSRLGDENRGGTVNEKS